MFFTASDFTFTTRHSHTWVLFLLCTSCFILSGAVSYCPPLFPVACWTSSYLGNSSSSVISFWLFILLMGFLWQEYRSGLPFPPSLDHVLSEFSTVTHLGWPCTVWLITPLSYTNPLPWQAFAPWRVFSPYTWISGSQLQILNLLVIFLVIALII